MTRQTTTTVLLQGGLDLATPAIAVKPGVAIGGYNYEPVESGYRRIGGFERYDGRPAPSEASYSILRFTNGSTEIGAGVAVEGGTSGGSAIAVLDAVLESGSYGGGDAAGYVVLLVMPTSQPFTDGEDLKVSSVKVAEADGTNVTRDAKNDTLDRTYLKAAADYARSRIAAPIGSGPIRGVVAFTDNQNYSGLFAFRDNAGETACDMFFDGIGTGWAPITLLNLLPFTNGNQPSGSFDEGDTITGGTSSATTIILKVVLQSGAWDGTGVGYFVVSNPAGTFTAETITTSGASASISGPPTAITFPPGGTYRFVAHNFLGTTGTKRLYGVNGVGRAFEFFEGFSNAPVVVPIRVEGLTDAQDKPIHIEEFSEHLFLFYRNGAIRVSSIGEPTVFNGTTGAAELGFGTEIRDVIVANTALVVFGDTKIAYITGTDATNWQVLEITDDSGASVDSAQMVDTPYYFDGRAIRRLSTTEALGGWKMGSVASQIQKFWEVKSRAFVTVVGSYRVRARDHYVLLLSDKSGVVTYLGRKRAEAMPIVLPFQASAIYSGDDLGRERVFLGAEDGFVYEMDAGRSFDGAEVDYLLVLGFISVGGAYRNNRWHKVRIGLEALDPVVTLAQSAEFSYASDQGAPGIETALEVSGGGARWDVGNWNEFYWSLPEVAEGESDIDGLGYNIGISLYGEADFEPSRILNWMTLFTTPRRQQG